MGSDRLLRRGLLALGAYHLLLGAVMVLAPELFFERVGPYGPYNDHYVRDVSTVYLAFGAAQALAAGRPPWRVPILAVTVLQYATHVVNHLWDVADADPAWLGPGTLVTLAVIGAVAWLLQRRAAR